MTQLPLWQDAENGRGAKCTITNTNNMVPICFRNTTGQQGAPSFWEANRLVNWELSPDQGAALFKLKQFK